MPGASACARARVCVCAHKSVSVSLENLFGWQCKHNGNQEIVSVFQMMSNRLTLLLSTDFTFARRSSLPR